jgi:hypothetical protein
MISKYTQGKKKITHPFYSCCRMCKIMLIHQSHKLQILLALTQGLVIKTAPAYTYQITLAADAQWLFTVNHTTTLG